MQLLALVGSRGIVAGISAAVAVVAIGVVAFAPVAAVDAAVGTVVVVVSGDCLWVFN